MSSLRTVSLAAFAVGSVAGLSCPSDLSPYTSEASPFGWPITPNEWLFSRPECWAEKYPMCGGQRQSPMNLDFTLTNAECTVKSEGTDGILSSQAHYSSVSSASVYVSDYMRSASIIANLGSLNLKDEAGNDVEYEAISSHLTAPALHGLNGVTAAAELMIVHKPKSQPDGLHGSVVLSVLFEEGAASTFFTEMGFLPTGSDEVHQERQTWSASVDFASALSAPLAGKSYSYSGSVPVPPCTENVQWIILSQKQTATAAQIKSLEGQLTKNAGGISKRPLQVRDPDEVCREITANSVVATPVPEVDCDAQGAEKVATCWKQACGLSPITIDSSEADSSQHAMDMTEMLQFEKTSDVTVAPSTYTLDAKGSFGRLMIQGRAFETTKISVKAISQHNVDGQRYAGELLIESVLYGDTLLMAAAEEAAAEETTAKTAEATAHSAHRRLFEEASVHKVMMSIPLNLGTESPLLRNLGLGTQAHKEAIKAGNSYTITGTVDLLTQLKASTTGDWYFYSGSEIVPGVCPTWGVKWMVFKEPLEASLEQLNYLALAVSGMDATLIQTPSTSANTDVYFECIPSQGVAIESCSHSDELLNDPVCWASTTAACSGTAQSPVDIETFTGSKVGNHSYLHKTSWKPVSGLRVANNGHSLHFETNQMGYTTIMGEDGFPKYYQVTGAYLKMPSEHTLDGQHFAAELQVVQKNQKTVLEYDDEDVIISSFLFEIGEENKLLKQMLDGGIAASGEYTTLETPVDLQWALGPSLDGTYYAYDGSYTIPDCSEVVHWTIFETPLTLSMEQWNAFKVSFPSPGNNRPLQALNGRAIVRNNMEEGEAVDYKFFLNRKMGRNYRTPNAALIAFPILGTLLLCSTAMLAIFQREDANRKSSSAGGIDASTIGRGYDKL